MIRAHDSSQKPYELQCCPINSEFIKSLAESSGDLILALDKSYKIIFSNSAFRKDFETIYGKVINDGDNFIHTLSALRKDSGDFSDILQRSGEDKKSKSTMILGSPGRLRKRYSVDCMSIRDQFNNPAGVLLRLKDEKKNELVLKQTENYLRKEERLLLTVHAANSYIFEEDLVEGTIYRSEGLYNVLGFLPEEAGNDPQWWRKRVHPDDLEICENNYKLLLSGKVSSNTCEYRILHKNGSYIYVWGHYHTAVDHAGKPTRILGIIFDITSRRLADQLLFQSKKFLKDTIDSLFVFAIVLKPDGTTSVANRAILQASGLSAEEVIGKPFQQLGCWPEGRGVSGRIGRAIKRAASGNMSRFDTEILRFDRSVMAIDFQIVPMYDDNGAISHLIASAIDISERKKAEIALRESDRHKDAFLAMLAHEMRSPLAPLSNAVQLIGHPGIGEREQQECVSIMKDQIDFIVRLVDDLLDISRISRGKITLKKEHFKVDRVLEQALKTCGATIEQNRHRLLVSNDAGGEMIHGDFTRITQILCNLIENASKYTPKGGRIETSTRREGNHILLSVSDNGIGITSEQQKLIFDMFMQAGTNKGKTCGGALGIGLTLAKSFAEMHNGSIEVFSEGEGKGSTFVVRLPVSSQSRVKRPPSAEASQNSASRNLNVLIVDDHNDAARTTARIMEYLGHKTTIASSGLEAMELAARLKPELVLLDISLPDIDGCEVCRRIRANENLYGRPFIAALTGWGSKESCDDSRLAGFDRHLVKPVPIASFEEISQTLISSTS